MRIPELIFWGAIAFVAYCYVGYPLLLALLARLARRPVDKQPRTPSVSLVICAYNEAGVIRRKLENCLALDYPRDALEIIVASDSSTDGTDAIVEEFRERGVRLLRPFPRREGKARMLNEAIPVCSGEIVVLSDARQVFDERALRELVAGFADPAVGAVSGELHLHARGGNAFGEGLSAYWSYEKSIRRLESEIDSVVGATGAIYAIRRSAFRPLRPNTMLDDVAIPMRIALDGYRVIFEPRATAFDEAAVSTREEWVRKVRTLSGNYQLLVQMPSLLNPFVNRLFWQFVSHKVFSRLLVPFALIAILAANLALLQGLYLVTLALQVAFYGLGVAGLLCRPGPGLARLLSLPQTLVLLNASSVAGLFHFLTVPDPGLWRKGER